MGDDARPKGPFVLNIRMSGRIVPFAAGLTVFALLPFLGGSTPGLERADVVLAAGTPAEVAAQDAVGAVEAARQSLAGQSAGALLGDAVSAGGGSAAFSSASGLFMFPSITLAPLTAQAIAAPIVGTLSPTGFIHPVPGGEASPFGPRIHPVLGRAMFHTGIDLMAACGTPIRAVADGKVIYARVSNSWGLRTILEHPSGVKTAYGHQSKFLVKEGDVVKQGQIIGLVGTTGWSTGCHLHFDVIINERYVDPAPYLGFAPSAADSIPYAVVPHFVLDQSGRMVRTVEDGDVPIPSRGSGSSSSADGSSSSPTATPTTSGTSTSSTTTTKPPTSTSTSTSTGTSTEHRARRPARAPRRARRPAPRRARPPRRSRRRPRRRIRPPRQRIRRRRAPPRRADPTTTGRAHHDDEPVHDERRAVDHHDVRPGAGRLERLDVPVDRDE